MNKYFLSIGDENQQSLATGWLWVAVGFLLASGVYPLLLALARTTYEMPWKDFFYTALVLHVDFTVLWWLLAIAGVFWNLNAVVRSPGFDWLAVFLVVSGGVVAGIAPLSGDSNPLTNNYVPMLENRMFIKGLIVFGGGVALLMLRSLIATPYKAMFSGDHEGALRFGVWTSAIAVLVALLALIWTFVDIPISHGRTYYEVLYWAGGHVLQFAHTALLAVCWLWLAYVCGIRIPAGPRVIMAIFAVGVLPAIFSPIAFLSYETSSAEFMMWFVDLMRYGNGTAPLLVGLAVAWGVVNGHAGDRQHHHLYASLLFSIFLFIVGGVLGLFIGESSTLITAHYHGSIVSVTMAFMAMVYYWLPQFGYGSPNLKWARIQVYTYAIGQTIHIIGLAWGGGHGMKRKVVGTTQDIGIQHWITPQDLVGLGGVLAVLSGILFAVVVLPVMFRGRLSPSVEGNP